MQRNRALFIEHDARSVPFLRQDERFAVELRIAAFFRIEDSRLPEHRFLVHILGEGRVFNFLGPENGLSRSARDRQHEGSHR